MTQDRFKSRSGFIFASIGAAVGLGNALRFPGLCARYGGAYLFVYAAALLLMGIPILNAEIALGRKFRAGAPKCMASLSHKAEPIGWASSFNSLFVAIIYAGILGWIIAMVIKIVPLSLNAPSLTQNQTSNYFFDEVLSPRGTPLSKIVCPAILGAWGLMYLCLRGGARSLSKIAKFTVIIPVLLLAFMAGRGLLYENSGEALYRLFVPDFSRLSDGGLWINAMGQAFFSLSILVGVMPAYGAYLPEGTNIFRDSLVIAAADFSVSILSSVVLFTTLYGCGLEESISSSGIETAFAVYPVAITRIFGINGGVANGIAGILFYLSLAMMALQSSVSMIEAALNPLSEKLKIEKKKIAAVICIGGGAVCLIFSSKNAAAALDISDHFANYFNILILGVSECAVLGRFQKRVNLAGEINRYSKRLKMPERYLTLSVKYLCPLVLSVLTVWGIYDLIASDGGLYGGYPLWQQIIFGWTVSLAAGSSGFILRLFEGHLNKRRRRKQSKIEYN